MIYGLKRSGRPLFLASVRTAEEARLALSGGADLIDCKEPSEGALGALPASQIASVVDVVSGRVPVSATVGDLPSEARVMVNAAKAVADAGADVVKVGFFGDAPATDAIAALGAAALGKAKLVGVLMADRTLDLTILDAMAGAGFAGVMLDTADKAHGSLTDILDARALTAFVDAARSNGLFAGLAGSLKVADIAAVMVARPDIIGFRGALCSGTRTATLEAQRVADVRRALDAAAASAAHELERSVA